MSNSKRSLHSHLKEADNEGPEIVINDSDDEESYYSGLSSEAESDSDGYSGGEEEEGKKEPAWSGGEADTSDEEEIRNTVGNIPLEWYDELNHIGYDVEGREILKHPSTNRDELDEFLLKSEDPDYWRRIRDSVTGKEVILTDQQIDMIRKLQKSSYPEAHVDPYEDYVDHFTSEKELLPLSRVPKPKSSFIPSKWEHQKIVKLVHAMRMGWIKPRPSAPSKPSFYQLWGEGEGEGAKVRHRMHIPTPRMKLPGHEESYNPPPEYLPSPQEREEWLAQDEEERSSNFIPQKYNSLREVPGYSHFIKERFERCLDIYLCPRQRKMRVQVDPEDLIPELPKLRDLHPFPTFETMVYEGHTGMVQCVAVETEGQWLASGGSDCSVRLWEVATGRCVQTLPFPSKPVGVAFPPTTKHSILAIAAGEDVTLVNSNVGDHLLVKQTDEFLLSIPLDSSTSCEDVEWRKEGGGGVTLHHSKPVHQVCWHGGADYLATLASDASGSVVLLHQLSKARSQKPFRKLKGRVHKVLFHPYKPLFFIATQTSVRVYDLARQELVKRLQTGVKWISSMAVHPSGDHLLVGSYDKKLCWFDLDLSAKPYKTLRQHRRAVRSVCFHPVFPLLASGSDDGHVIVSHGKVFNDLLQNPQIIPVKMLQGSASVGGLGVLECVFHPSQPWIFTAGADSTIRLYS